MHSHINYGCQIFGSANQNILNKLSALQNKSIRNLAKLKYNAHTNLTYYDLGILKLNDQIKYNRILFMHKYRYGMLPDVFNNMYTYNLDTDARSSRQNDCNFVIPETASKIRSPYIDSIINWNSIPYNLKSIRKHLTFKSELKKFFIEKYNTICDVQNCYSCR